MWILRNWEPLNKEKNIDNLSELQRYRHPEWRPRFARKANLSRWRCCRRWCRWEPRHCLWWPSWRTRSRRRLNVCTQSNWRANFGDEGCPDPEDELVRDISRRQSKSLTAVNDDTRRNIIDLRSQWLTSQYFGLDNIGWKLDRTVVRCRTIPQTILRYGVVDFSS